MPLFSKYLSVWGRKNKKRRQPQKTDDPTNELLPYEEDHLESEVNPKMWMFSINEDNHKNEDNPKIEDVFQNEDYSKK